MDREYEEKIKKLKAAILEYLGVNGRHYADKTRTEQHVEDLAQALNTGLDQLLLCLKNKCHDPPQPESPRERLANRFLETAAKLSQGGKVDAETVDQFEASLDLLDVAANLRRQAGTAQDAAETAIVKHKRSRG